MILFIFIFYCYLKLISKNRSFTHCALCEMDIFLFVILYGLKFISFIIFTENIPFEQITDTFECSSRIIMALPYLSILFFLNDVTEL